tara:strand:+ start:1119 stop:1547 length:429 start_codon:yes stop_codon:yes gene_type:complete
MSKPVLSELEYNASDVASAILSKADLSVTNEDLGVTDRSSLFVYQSGWDDQNKVCYSFNGFMFCSFLVKHSDTTPDNPETFCVISDSDFYPTETVYAPTVSYEGDLAFNITFNSDGNIKVHIPVNINNNSFYICVNAWYRYT